MGELVRPIMYIINVWCSPKHITIKANKNKYNHTFKFISLTSISTFIYYISGRFYRPPM